MRPMNFAAMLATATAVTVGVANTAQAVTITDRIDVLEGVNATIGGDATEIDHWTLAVNTAGTVTFDVLSWEWDRDNDGTARFIDPMIFLFSDDGSLDAGDLIAMNDDSASGTADGSTSTLDSYLSLNLAAGSYILAIADYNLSAANAVNTVNYGGYMPAAMTNSVTEYNFIGCPILGCPYGDYQITITGDVTLANNMMPLAPVPLPASIVLMFAGLGGLTALRRR